MEKEIKRITPKNGLAVHRQIIFDKEFEKAGFKYTEKATMYSKQFF